MVFWGQIRVNMVKSGQLIVWRKCRQNQPNLAKNVHHEVLIDFDTLDGML